MADDKTSNVLHVTSREYKLILTSDRFFDRSIGALALLDLVRLLVTNRDAEITEQTEEEVRRTFYLDTPAFHLRQAGFAMRIRFEESDEKYKISLKHRTPDRYLAASKDIGSSLKEESLKFEEDIVPTFRSVFSQSNSLWFEEAPKLEVFNDATKLFPGLDLLSAPKKAALVKVSEFEAHEVFRKLCKIKFRRKKPNVKMGLSFWYHTPRDKWPLIAECAFDYDTDKGDDFSIHVVEGANQLFRFLQNQPGWFDLDATTKTRYVYEGLA